MHKKIKAEETHEPIIRQFPHCDQRVLHAPGECRHCDEHKEWQELRIKWGIAFTGYEPDGNELPDPATHARGNPHVWGGNRPTPAAQGHTAESAESFFSKPHEILKCSCGAVILQCRCLGPHTMRTIVNGCPECKAKSSEK